MKSVKIMVLFALAGLIILLAGSFFVVREGQQALITQFGKPVGGPYKEAGLYIKIPFVQDVHTFEKRLLKWDGSPNRIPTRDKKYIWVDTTARWRITDPLRFLQTVATENGAQSRLDDIIDSAVRDKVSSNLLVELVRSADWDPDRVSSAYSEMPDTKHSTAVKAKKKTAVEREKLSRVQKGRNLITRQMLTDAAKMTPQFGIELVDVQIKRINYDESVQRRVFERMISERKRIASQYRSEGEGEKQSILGDMKKQLARIRSKAYKQAQEIRGKADAEATKIYGIAFGADPQFYALFKTLESYANLPPGKAEIILTTDGEYMRYLSRVP